MLSIGGMYYEYISNNSTSGHDRNSQEQGRLL